jgi:hypothetical protein
LRAHLKRIFIGTLQTGAVLVAVLIVFMAYVAYAERAASAQAGAFCERIRIGSSSSDILAQGLTRGADARHSGWFRDQYNGDNLSVTFTGASPLSRYICKIDSKEGRVTSREVIYLD